MVTGRFVRTETSELTQNMPISRSLITQHGAHSTGESTISPGKMVFGELTLGSPSEAFIWGNEAIDCRLSCLSPRKQKIHTN